MFDSVQTKDDAATLNANTLVLQEKWNTICQRLHQAQQFPRLDLPNASSLVPSAEGFHLVRNGKEGSSKNSSRSESQTANSIPCMPTDLQKIVPFKENIHLPMASDVENASFQPEPSVKVSKSQQIGMESPWLSTCSIAKMSMPPDRTSSTSVTSVTTDLGLGTLYASTSRKLESTKVPPHRGCLQHFSGSISEVDAASESTSHQIAHSSSCSGPTMGGQYDVRDLKELRRSLAEKVCWQDEAIYSISQAISRCRSGDGRRCGSNLRGGIWLTFLGQDKVGKKRIASALAEIIFGTRESLICVDLGFQGRVVQSNSMFENQEFEGYDMKFRGKTLVDYIAGELRKKPQSVVFLQNVDKADLLAQSSLSQSLSQAIRTGKFADSYGREISINNMIFVITSSIAKDTGTSLATEGPVEFSEERILKAKRYKMKILVECVAHDACRCNVLNVRLTSTKGMSNPVSVNKRKLIETCGSGEQKETFKIQEPAQKVSRSYLDLNMPVDELGAETNHRDCESDTISENLEACLEEFFDLVDEKVIFKPFNFDALAGKVVKDISLQFQRTFGSEAMLEMDYEVMVQILAAAWLSDRDIAVQEWTEQVLCRSFDEAQRKYHLTAQSVLKLVSCEGSLMEEQAPGICLPARIIVS